MEALTVNKALVLIKTIRERLGDLKKLREGVANKRIFMSDTREVYEPQYDVRTLDAVVLELQSILFQLESSIKESNAVTIIEVEADFSAIFRSLS